MARKKNKPAFEMLLELVAFFPWWVGLSLAVMSYFVLHALAAPVAATAIDTKQISDIVAGSFWKALAYAGQFIIPLACTLGAAASAFRRFKRKSLVDNVAQSNTADALDNMRWLQFEQLVGEAFRLDGFAVEERGGAGADGGIDLVLRKGGEKFLVQCKQWRALKVSVDVVRELYGVMAASGATGGFVVTSGVFTKDAIEFASGRNVVLIDGAILFEMIKRSKRAPIGLTNPAIEKSSTTSSPSASSQVNCPICGSVMIQRTAKRGTNAGSIFWGCSNYPACKGTRAMGK